LYKANNSYNRCDCICSYIRKTLGCIGHHFCSIRHFGNMADHISSKNNPVRLISKEQLKETGKVSCAGLIKINGNRAHCQKKRKISLKITNSTFVNFNAQFRRTFSRTMLPSMFFYKLGLSDSMQINSAPSVLFKPTNEHKHNSNKNLCNSNMVFLCSNCILLDLLDKQEKSCTIDRNKILLHIYIAFFVTVALIDGRKLT
jgi:hypothetical protein